MTGQVSRSEVAFGPPPSGPHPSWTRSRFADAAWSYTDYYGRERALDFDLIPEGFRRLSKHFLWALEYVVDARMQRTAIKSSGAFNNSYLELRHLFRACVKLNIKRLMSIDEDTLKVIAKHRFEDARLGKNVHEFTTRRKALAFYQRLYWLGPAGLGVLPDGLAFLVEESAITTNDQIKPTSSTPLIKDDAAQEIFASAILYLSHATTLLNVFSAEYRFKQSLPKPIYFYTIPERRKRHFMEQGVLHELEADCKLLQSLFGHIATRHKLPKGHDESYSLNLMNLRRLHPMIRHLVAACYIVIAGFTGFRFGEILSMKRDDVVRRGGRVIVKTTITKTAASPGGYEADRVAPPIVYDAYVALDRLAAIFERDDDLLWLDASGQALTNPSMNAKLLLFQQDVANLKDWRLRTHQFRRYFAVFFVRRFKGSVDALQYNFRHVSQTTVDAYIRDATCAKYLAETKKAFVQEIMHDAVHGLGGYTLHPSNPMRRAELSYRAANLPIEDIERELQRLVGAYTTVRATEWGYCVWQKENGDGAVCGGKDGIRDLNEMFPANCSGCMYLAVGTEQVPFWKHTAEVHRVTRCSRNTTPLASEAARVMLVKADALLERANRDLAL